MSASPLYTTLLDRYRSLLRATRQDKPPSALFIIDENIDPASLAAFAAVDHLKCITNRVDIADHCRKLNLPCVLSDFDFISIKSTFDICLYRISKERALCHHVLNHLSSLLAPRGRCLLIGKKNEGIKTYGKKLTYELGFSGKIEKEKDNYVAALTAGPITSTVKLDDQNYPRWRELCLDSLTFVSKPGIYGWNKIDRGSAFLLDELLPIIQGQTFARILDLGCGYGYLSLRLLKEKDHHDIAVGQLIATDNNIAAVAACEKNLRAAENQAELKLDIVADDCGSTITEDCDLILCNPPFHQGFENNRELSAKFLAASWRLLSKNGVAYFVVNVFVPLEALAKTHFSSITTLANNRQFKIIALAH